MKIVKETVMWVNEATKKHAGELLVFFIAIIIVAGMLSHMIDHSEEKRMAIVKEMTAPQKKIQWGPSGFSMADANGTPRVVMLGFQEDGQVLWGLGQEVKPQQGAAK